MYRFRDVDGHSRQGDYMKKRAVRPSIVEIPVELPYGPLSPWLRIALTDSRQSLKPETTAVKKLHHDFQMLLLLEGTTWIWCEALQGSIDLRPGDLLFIPPGFVHGWCYSREVHLAVHFDLQANPDLPNFTFYGIELLKSRVSRKPVDTMPVFRILMEGGSEQHELRIPMVTRLKMPEIWRERFEHLTHIWQTHTGDTLDGQLMANEIITWGLNSLAHGTEGVESLNPRIDPRIADLMRTIRDPRKRAELERLSTSALARRTSMGIAAFRREFRAATGRHPHEYMTERRIEQAALMLVQSDSKVADVARAVGYDDQYHFSRVFRRVTGLSPSHYREHYLTSRVMGRQE
jgi:AraC-like DNA-binding protein